MNLLGAIAVIASIVAFALTHRWLVNRRITTRCYTAAVLTVLEGLGTLLPC